MKEETPRSSYKRHRFPPEIIAHFVWLYFRFALSLCGVRTSSGTIAAVARATAAPV